MTSRRKFLTAAGAGIAGLLHAPRRSAAQTSASHDADLVVFNAKV